MVVIDLVRAYTHPDGPFALPAARPAVEATAQLVGAARDKHVPVVWTVVRYAAGLADGGLFVRKVPDASSAKQASAGTLRTNRPPSTRSAA